MFPLLWKKIQDIVGQVAKPDTYGENESNVKYKYKVQYLHVVTRAWHPWETLLDVPSLATRPPQINQDGAGISSGNPNQCGHCMTINYQNTKYVLHNMWTLVPALTCQLITQRGARCIHVVTTVTPPWLGRSLLSKSISSKCQGLILDSLWLKDVDGCLYCGEQPCSRNDMRARFRLSGIGSGAQNLALYFWIFVRS